MKSPVRENRPPGSVRGAPGNWRPYLDIKAVRLADLGGRKARRARCCRRLRGVLLDMDKWLGFSWRRRCADPRRLCIGEFGEEGSDCEGCHGLERDDCFHCSLLFLVLVSGFHLRRRSRVEFSPKEF